MVASMNSNIDLMELLIECKADVNKENVNGMTPLHSTCLSGNI